MMNFKSLALDALQNIKFPTTTTRKNISSNKIESFTLGDVNYRGQKFLQGKVKGPSKWNKKFPDLFSVLKLLIETAHPGFKYTTIQVNKNVLTPPHVDKNNVGPSYIIGLGSYAGGDLNVEGKKFNIKNRWKYFDGTKGHWTEPFSGDRYSIIYFTHTFKPPHPDVRNLEVKKGGLYKDGSLLKKYKKSVKKSNK